VVHGAWVQERKNGVENAVVTRVVQQGEDAVDGPKTGMGLVKGSGSNDAGPYEIISLKSEAGSARGRRGGTVIEETT